MNSIIRYDYNLALFDLVCLVLVFKNIVEIALRGCQDYYRLIARLRLFLEHFRDILQNLFDLIFKSLMGETLRMKNLNDFGFYYDLNLYGSMPYLIK